MSAHASSPGRYAVLHPAIPVEVPVPPVRWRVRAVIPCYNRRHDAELLLSDLASLDFDRAAVELSVLLVDNASNRPLSELPSPPALRLTHLRLPHNTGGSGGFNAGMRATLAAGVPHDEGELIWLLDSDARLDPGALTPLLAALESDPDLVAAGSALADPQTGEVYEMGGRVDRDTGEYEVPPPGNDPVRRVEYTAACSLLVRRWAVERAGLMADVFVFGDDAEWCMRLARATGGHVAAVRASVARHPRFDRMRTWSRYYGSRNAFAAMAAAGCGARCRLRRALREVGRAASQTMMGRDDLAALHLRGLRDAAEGRITGPMPRDLKFDPPRPIAELGAAVREVAGGRRIGRVSLGAGLDVEPEPIVKELRRLAVEPVRERRVTAWSPATVLSGLRRLLSGPPADLAVVSPRGRPGDWMAGRVLVTVWPEGFAARRIARMGRARALTRVLLEGASLSARLALRPPPAPAASAVLDDAGSRTPDLRVGALSVVVLSYNRWSALERTLSELAGDGAPDAGRTRVIVVDNASSDGSPGRVAQQFPGVEVLTLEKNLGVDAYNRGVERADTDYILILDDDARPEPGVIAQAVTLLDQRPDLAAVALNPCHPENARSEWPFGKHPSDRWPVMGCANVVRRTAWNQVGGYDAAYFLYRNDTDLALKLLAAGHGVHFNPDWIARHDSPAAAAKSARWFRLATRNWVWLCRRHGRGWWRVYAILLGWGWAHALAGFSIPSQLRVLRGALAGFLRKPPRLVDALRVDGSGLRHLLRVRYGQASSASSPRHSA